MNNVMPTAWAAVLLVVFCSFLAGCTVTTDTGPEQTITPTPTAAAGETGTAGESVVAANNLFAFDIYEKIASEKSEDDNLFLSPFSISSAFALTYEGAKGETAEEIKTVFHFPGDIEDLRNGFLDINTGINAGDPEYELRVANALWAEQTYPFLESYISTAADYYSAKTTNLDFKNHPEESRVIINEWVEDKTNDRIKELIKKGIIDTDTCLVITNAIYFKGKWVWQFDKGKTSEADFKTSSGDIVRVDMMQRTDEDAIYGYAETGDLQLLRMPYKHDSGKELSMLVLLPKENDIGVAGETLTTAGLKALKNSMKNSRVKVYFPKFKIETGYELSKTLSDMGMPTAFSGGADFSGMDGTGGLFITDVVHKAFVEVNEEGTEAAAATAVIMGKGFSPQEEPVPVFRADHPFVFMIQDDETGNILFIGRISNPAGA